MIEKDRQDENPIGLCKLILCSVFALLPYPHKAGRFQGFETIRVPQIKTNPNLFL